MDEPLDLSSLSRLIRLPNTSAQTPHRSNDAAPLPVTPMSAAPDTGLSPAIQALIPEFLENQRKELAKVRTCLSQEDFRAIQRFGHNLKGTAAGYGFPALGELGASLEAAAAESNTQGVVELLAAVDAMLGRSARSLSPRRAAAVR